MPGRRGDDFIEGLEGVASIRRGWFLRRKSSIVAQPLLDSMNKAWREE